MKNIYVTTKAAASVVGFNVKVTSRPGLKADDLYKKLKDLKNPILEQKGDSFTLVDEVYQPQLAPLEMVWLCDICGKVYSRVREKVVEHEKDCRKNLV